MTGRQGRHPDSPQDCLHIGGDQVEVTGVGPGHWSHHLPPIPVALVKRLDEIADELTPQLREWLREAGVPNPERYRLAYDATPSYDATPLPRPAP